MKLSPQQIEKLFVFTRQHYVEYYDLQLELVDHLANAIERQWQENLKLTFDQALNSEFKKFGIFGFQDVIEKKQKAMTKIYNRFIWQNFKDFFTISNTIVTFSIGMLLFWLFSLPFINHNILVIFIVPQIIIMIYQSIQHRKSIKTRQKSNSKKWFLEEMIRNVGSSMGLFFLAWQFILKINNLDNLYIRIVASIAIVVSFVFFYIIVFTIPSKSQEFLNLSYPEYKFE